MDGPETRSETRCDGRSVFARVAKPLLGDEKPVFHRLINANSPAALNPCGRF